MLRSNSFLFWCYAPIEISSNMLRNKLKNISLLSYVEGDLYMKPKVFKNGNLHIGLFMKDITKKKDKHIYWISAEEADIFADLGVVLID